MRSPALLMLSNRLRARGFAPIRFDYASLFRSPAKSMEKLAMKLYGFGKIAGDLRQCREKYVPKAMTAEIALAAEAVLK